MCGMHARVGYSHKICGPQAKYVPESTCFVCLIYKVKKSREVISQAMTQERFPEKVTDILWKEIMSSERNIYF